MSDSKKIIDTIHAMYCHEHLQHPVIKHVDHKLHFKACCDNFAKEIAEKYNMLHQDQLLDNLVD